MAGRVSGGASLTASTLIALDVALGVGDYYDIGALYSDERGSADFHYRLLNAVRPRRRIDPHIREVVRTAGRGNAEAGSPKSPYLGDDYAFAQTSPVYVVRNGTRYVKASDVTCLADTVRAIWARMEKSRRRSDAERDAFKAVDRALDVYQKRAAEAAAIR